MRRKSESNELSHCETILMKTIWRAGEDISIQDLIVRLREQANLDYARTTVCTFLGKMADKGYISTYRKGKNSYIHAEKKEDWYREKKVNEETDFWFDGKPSQLMSALFSSREISGDEIEKMRKMLDELDA